jgi:hypothetical protein
MLVFIRGSKLSDSAQTIRFKVNDTRINLGDTIADDP